MEQAQQGQTQPVQAKPEVQQPKGEQTQPVKEKKSKWLIWLIVALVIIGVGVGVYFLGKHFDLF